MLWTRSELKGRAKFLLKQNYWYSVLAALIYTFLLGNGFTYSYNVLKDVYKRQLLEELDFWSRYEKLSLKLVNEMQIMEIKEELQRKVKSKVDKHQKEYLLREQLKVIREELGEDTT